MTDSRNPRNRPRGDTSLIELQTGALLYLAAVGDLAAIGLAAMFSRLVIPAGGASRFHGAVALALAFLIGWFAVAGWFGTYRSSTFATVRTCVRRTLSAWGTAAVIAIVLGLLFSRHPFSPWLVALMVVLTPIVLLLWRGVVVFLGPWRPETRPPWRGSGRSTPQGAG